MSQRRNLRPSVMPYGHGAAVEVAPNEGAASAVSPEEIPDVLVEDAVESAPEPVEAEASVPQRTRKTK